MKKCLCVGSIGWDILAWPIKKFPQWEELIISDKVIEFIGGCAANVSLVMAKLGTSVKIVGRIGNDIQGRQVMSSLNSEGVDVRGVILTENNQTGTSITFVSDEAQRSFIYAPGVNQQLCFSDVLRVFPETLDEGDFLHFSDVFLLPGLDGEPAIKLLKIAKKNKLVTSLDTSWDPHNRWMTLLRPYFPLLDYFFTNLHEASRLLSENRPNKIADAFITLGAKNVVIKMGAKGCYVKSDQGTELKIQPHRIVPLDTTGAGDSFVGSFLSAVMANYDLEAAATLATRIAEFSIQALGATKGVPRYSSINDALNNLVFHGD